MFNSTKILVIAAFVSLAANANAYAKTNPGYQASIIHNSTKVNLNFDVAWGNGPWQRTVLRPGERVAKSNNQSTSYWKVLRVRFDCDPGPGVNMQEYKIRTNRYPTTLFKHLPPTEVFRFQPNGVIDLLHNR